MNQARLEELTGIISRTVTVEQIYLFGSMHTVRQMGTVIWISMW